jgi:phage terminase large subunit-like protein
MSSWNFAQPDWADRIMAGLPLMPDLPLDRKAAKAAVEIWNEMRLPDVIGQPKLREAGADWFRDIVAAVFGSLTPEGERLVRELFCLVPKKNAKTTNSAALMLTALIVNRRPNAGFFLIGPTQQIADLAFAAAHGMIKADGELDVLFKVSEHTKTIKYLPTGATLKVLTFDAQVATGVRPAGVLIDELHLMGRNPRAASVLGQLRGGMVSVPEAFLIIITTQSDEPPAGVFREELQRARAIRDGAEGADDAMLPILYEFPEAIQTGHDRRWRNPDLWRFVTPNAGRSITVDRLVSDYAIARAKGDAEERRWVSQHLNVEIGLALHSNRWVGADHWERAAEPGGLTLEQLIARSEVCTIGIDGGGLDDLLGLTVIGRCRSTGGWLTWSRAWCDTGVLTLRTDIASRLHQLAEAGEVGIVSIGAGEGASDDVLEVADIVQQIHEAGLLPEAAAIGLDAVGVAAIVDELVARGIPQEMMVAIPQGYRLSGNIKGAARKLKERQLRHAGQALMAWCVGNARSELRGSAELITKQVSGSAKIDPLVALFNAFDLMSRHPVAAGASAYEYTGL